MDNNKQQNTKSKCTCIEHDPYCCQIHGNCPVCVKPEDPEDVVLGYKTSLVAQTLDSKGNKQQTVVEWLEIELEKLWVEKYLSPITIKPLLDKAKEMEKEQIEKAELDAKEIIIIKHTEHGGGEQ